MSDHIVSSTAGTTESDLVYTPVMEHSFKIADNIVYLVPLSKVVSSIGRIRKVQQYGGIPYIFILSASSCGFPFGFPAAAVHFQKGYKRPITIELKEETNGRKAIRAKDKDTD